MLLTSLLILFQKLQVGYVLSQKEFHKDLYSQGFSEYYFSGEQWDINAAHAMEGLRYFSFTWNPSLPVSLHTINTDDQYMALEENTYLNT